MRRFQGFVVPEPDDAPITEMGSLTDSGWTIWARNPETGEMEVIAQFGPGYEPTDWSLVRPVCSNDWIRAWRAEPWWKRSAWRVRAWVVDGIERALR